MKDVLGNHLKDLLFHYVRCLSITHAKDQSRIHQFGKKVLPGLFLGYALYADGIWKGDVLIADLEEVETMDASEIYSKRLNAKETSHAVSALVAHGGSPSSASSQITSTFEHVRFDDSEEHIGSRELKLSEPGSLPSSAPMSADVDLSSIDMRVECLLCTSTPRRSETNGFAERAVRRVKEGTSAVLLQSGLGNERWADSMECCCYLRKIQALLSDGKSPYERRFGMPFDGSVIPFGAMVEYHFFFCERPIEINIHLFHEQKSLVTCSRSRHSEDTILSV